MPPKPTGTIEEHVQKDGTTITFRARVRAAGRRHRITFGTNVEGWNRQRAENELVRIVREIERGIWTPPEVVKTEPLAATRADGLPEDVTFHVYASKWWSDNKLEYQDKGVADYEWRLSHLLRHLAEVEVRAFETSTVDRYRRAILRENEALAAAHAAAVKNPPPLTPPQRELLTELVAADEPLNLQSGYKRRTARKLVELELAHALDPHTFAPTALGQRLATGPRRPKRRPLRGRALNMTIDLLAQILDEAVEAKRLASNPARGKKRRAKELPRAKHALDPGMALEVIETAKAWERADEAIQRYGVSAFFAFLLLAGPRINELIDALRTRVDLVNGRTILGKKTEAGTGREVELSAYLVDVLTAHIAATPPELKALATLPVFPSGAGGRLNDSNVRSRWLAEVIAAVDERRRQDGEMLLPENVTPHTFRRTYATLALTAGRDPRFVMAQLGHTDARFTLKVYAQVMQRQRVDYELVWRLMRFSDEPGEWPGPRARQR